MKYGRYEYERCFIVSNETIKEHVVEVKKITDTYLIDLTLRLRKVENKDEIQYKLTQKKELNPVRKGIKAINTFYLTKSEYEKLITLPGYKIEKKRHIIIKQETRIGIDEIELGSEKLYLAEIEYKTEEEMEKNVIPISYKKEVTGDINYSGFEIAKLYSKKIKK